MANQGIVLLVLFLMLSIGVIGTYFTITCHNPMKGPKWDFYYPLLLLNSGLIGIALMTTLTLANVPLAYQLTFAAIGVLAVGTYWTLVILAGRLLDTAFDWLEFHIIKPLVRRIILRRR